MKSVDERIKYIEDKYVRPFTPGTSISRILFDEGIKWCIAIGALAAPKIFFYGDSIEGILLEIEKEFP